jgi:ribonuclease P protein component
VAKFTKEERLCSKKAIEILLKNGSPLFLFPFKITWIKTDFPISAQAQIAIAVPKRRFKRANQRNMVKRRIRETYRKHKHLLYEFLSQKEIRIQFLIVYIAPDILSYHDMEPKIKDALHLIMAAVKKAS